MTPKELKTEQDCSHRQLFHYYCIESILLWLQSHSVLSSLSVVLLFCKENFYIVGSIIYDFIRCLIFIYCSLQ